MRADWILYKIDFPHPTCMAQEPATAATSPRTFVAEGLGGMDEGVLKKGRHDNAAALYPPRLRSDR